MKLPKNVKKIESIFIVEQELLADEEYTSMIMIGTKSWNAYLLERPKCQIVEEDKDVLFIEFDCEKDLFTYKNELDDKLFLEYSLEHKKPCLIQCA